MLRRIFVFLLSLFLCSAAVSQPLEQKLIELQSSIQSQLTELQKRSTIMENMLITLFPKLKINPETLEQDLMSLQSSWNNTLQELENCYTDINYYKDLSTKKDFTIKSLTKTLIVLIVLIIIKIIIKIINMILALKGIPLPRLLEILL